MTRFPGDAKLIIRLLPIALVVGIIVALLQYFGLINPL